MRDRLRLVANDRQRFEIRRGAFVLQQILGEMKDRGERVVQLVRHARDKLAERRELFGLAERLLRGAQRSDVLDEALGEPERAALVAIGARADAHGHGRCRPCDATRPRRFAPRRAFRDRCITRSRSVVEAKHVARDVELEELRRRLIPEQLRERRVDGDAAGRSPVAR